MGNVYIALSKGTIIYKVGSIILIFVTLGTCIHKLGTSLGSVCYTPCKHVRDTASSDCETPLP